MNLILFGSPGAGKGTQSVLLVEKKGYVQISTGDLFRAAIKGKTDLGLKAQAFMDKGDLVPDEIVIGMVEEAMKGLHGKSFIMDGFPRTVPQAEAFDKMLGRNGLRIDKVVSLEVPREILLERLAGRRVCKNCGSVYHAKTKPPVKAGVCDSCGGEVVLRPDDREEVVLNRLVTYERSTAPVKDFYKGQGKFAELDGNRQETAVYGDLQVLLES